MMMKIKKARKEKYKKLGAREFYSFNDPQVKTFITRGLDEGIEFLSKEYSEHHGFFLALHRKDLTDVDIASVGIPMDTGAPLRSGSRAGPEAVEAWSRKHDPIHPITKTIPFELCSIIDYGEVKFNSFEYSKRIDEIYEVYHRLNSANVTPLSVGGEHTITYPILKALGGEEPLGLIHLDAHADTFGTLGARINDGSHLRCAVVDGVLDPERTIQIGIRGRSSFK
jgi:arginase family enzyme